MQYIEVKCHIQPADLGNEIVTAFLAEIGYESFMETEDGTLLAYIQQAFFNEKKLKHLLDGKNVDFTFSYEINTIQEENWNAVWESNYKPVLIENTCFIQATFSRKKKKCPIRYCYRTENVVWNCTPRNDSFDDKLFIGRRLQQ